MAVKHGTVIDGKYEIQREIGKGGMSVVYLAMDNRLNKLWAVKVIQRQGIGKNNEVVINTVPDDTELMKKLDHPSIPRIVDIIDKPNDPQIYIVMDYIEGESLDKILDEFGAQPQDMVIDWAKQICDTLSYLHSQKPPIIYRDMKPANIMLSPNGNIKLIDFGIAREYKEGNLADTTVLGTKGYASPEHYGGRQTDERSDIYTLGMTMHHLITGVDPRPKGYEYIPIREYNPELSDGLEYIINKCTALDPEDRYQNCGELMYDLQNYKLLTKDFKKKQKRKLSTFIALIAMMLVFLIFGGVFSSMSGNQYDNLAKSASIEDIYKAIEVNNRKTDAYEALLNKGQHFDYNEWAEFDTVFRNIGISKTSKEYFDLEYKYCETYLFVCVDDTLNLQDRLHYIEPYLTHILNNDVDHITDNYDKAKTYYTIYNVFYDNSNDDVDAGELNDTITVLAQCIEELNLQENSTSYSVVANLKEINNLLDSYVDVFAEQGVDKKSVYDLFGTIKSVAGGFKDQIKAKKNVEEIINNYDKYIQDLDYAYENAANVEATGKGGGK